MTYCVLQGLCLTAPLLQIHHVCDKWRMMFLIATTFSCTVAQPWGTRQKRSVCEIISAINVSKCVHACLNLKLMQLIMRITADEVLVCNLSVVYLWSFTVKRYYSVANNFTSLNLHATQIWDENQDCMIQKSKELLFNVKRYMAALRKFIELFSIWL